ncbi:unnamed protein product [Ceratitis capitata]|uniref:(Mediterranean fruit fly) hypothetical protein n=1 Tax=Ceratitis capitata TaxID=7213 RepID=A0A811UZT5_CERCA|nr:unnamed protein product [Ceratitis capitata]
MNRLQIFIALSAVLCCVCAAPEIEDHWVWSKRRNDAYSSRPLHDNTARYPSANERRNARARDREPTTRRPLPGQPPNDEIDDYPDEDVNTNVGTRNFPYLPFGSGHLFGVNYPSLGGGIGSPIGNGNGILVGPGGPTGVIGRPPPQYPSGFPANGFAGQPGVGFPAQPGIFGGGNALGNGGQFGQAGTGGYSGAGAGLNPAFGGQFGGVGQFPGGQGAQYPGGGQYPIGGQFGAGVQYPGSFGTSGSQYPGAQFPAAQYPGANGGGPQYTEGYGLAASGYPGYLHASIGGGPFGYDGPLNDNENANRKLQPEGKDTVVVESSKLTKLRVDDKINKGLTKVPH